MNGDKLLLIGDNPFHGVSHLSQARARARQAGITTPGRAAGVVAAAVDSGANGFLFSVNETTLAILRILRGTPQLPARLYAIVPYSYAYVRSAIALGGLPGLARKVGREIVAARNGRALLDAVGGVVTGNPRGLLRAYVTYEINRLREAVGTRTPVASVLLHEVVTDMALALNMEWLFRAFVRSVSAIGVAPGFDTRNLSALVQRLRTWGIEMDGLVFAAPFNTAGFQMSPSREECEKALVGLPGATLIAFSVLAAGYASLSDAAAYVVGTPRLDGVAIGVSSAEQARTTFALFRDALHLSPGPPAGGSAAINGPPPDSRVPAEIPSG
jgi:hypothetical protein